MNNGRMNNMTPTDNDHADLALNNTNVGSITLQQDTANTALFSFLGRLQDYQSI